MRTTCASVRQMIPLHPFLIPFERIVGVGLIYGCSHSATAVKEFTKLICFDEESCSFTGRER
jgi:hypothetical protein